jgi:hypothetical protein
LCSISPSAEACVIRPVVFFHAPIKSPHFIQILMIARDPESVIL